MSKLTSVIFLLVLATGNVAFSRTVGFFVTSENGKSSADLQSLCDLATIGAQHVYGQGKKVPCQQVPAAKIPGPQQTYISVINPKFDINILVWEDLAGDHHLYISNVNPFDETEFKHAQWTLSGANIRWKELLTRLSTSLMVTIDNIKAIKQDYLNIALKVGSTKVKVVDGHYVNPETNQTIGFEEAYNLFVSEGPRQKSYLQATLQIMVAFVGGISWYYRNNDFNKVDFQFGNDKRQIVSRFFTFNQVRFDDNDAITNLMHFNAGINDCLAARFAGFNKYECFVASIVTSSLWEYAIEYREVVSINDQIVTGIGGAIIGNVLYETGHRLLLKLREPIVKLLEFVFGGNDAAVRWIAGHMPKNRVDVGQFGFDPDAYGFFEIGFMKYNHSYEGKTTSETNLHIASEFCEIPLGPGSFSGFLDPNCNKLFFEKSLSTQAISYLRFIAQMSYKGFYKQSITENPNGELRGFSFRIVPSSAVDIQRDKIDNVTGQKMNAFKEMVANVKVLGTTVTFEGYFNGFRFQGELEGFADFAMVRSFALAEYRDQVDLTDVPSVIQRQGYYYATGLSGATTFKISKDKSEIGVRTQSDHFNDLEWRSRFKEKETGRVNLSDTRDMKEVFAKYTSNQHVAASCVMRWETRGSQIEGLKIMPQRDRYKGCGLMVIW